MKKYTSANERFHANGGVCPVCCENYQQKILTLQKIFIIKYKQS